MSIKMPKDVGDYPKFGFDVGIACDACGRVAVFKLGDVGAFFVVRRIPTALPLITTVFTCKCGNQACRSIAVPVGQRPSPQEAYGKLLHPIYVTRKRERDV